MLCGGCYDNFQAPFTPADTWKQYSFSWTQLKQQGFGDMQPNVCASEIFALQFQWPANTQFELCLDDVAFTTASGTPDPHPAQTPVAQADSVPVHVSGGGCACTSASTNRTGASHLAVAALGLLGLALRRRRSRSSGT
jgi:MYXO-CTERM domain-containing protein